MCNGLVSNLNVTKALTPLSAVIDICNSGTPSPSPSPLKLKFTSPSASPSPHATSPSASPTL